MIDYDLWASETLYKGKRIKNGKGKVRTHILWQTIYPINSIINEFNAPSPFSQNIIPWSFLSSRQSPPPPRSTATTTTLLPPNHWNVDSLTFFLPLNHFSLINCNIKYVFSIHAYMLYLRIRYSQIVFHLYDQSFQFLFNIFL